MARSEKYISIIIFTVFILAFSSASGYQFVGDWFEKIINGAGMFISLLIMVALFGIYKGAALFSSNQLKILAYSMIVVTLLTYLYPLFKYTEQNSQDFMSTFFYDVIINVIIFVLLIKEAKK